MKVVIPLAGLGTRLRPHTYSRPKPLVSLAGQPLLGHILDRLVKLPIDEVIFITGYLGDQIEEYVSTKYDFNARYVVQEEQLGQAHALHLASPWLQGPTFIVFADTIFETDLNKLNSTQSDGVIYVHEVSDPRRFGVAVTDDNGHITKLVEKPSTPISNQAIVGLYYFSQGEKLCQAIEEQLNRGEKTKGEFYISDAIQIMIDNGAKLEVQNMDVWLDCGTPSALLESNRYLLAHATNEDQEDLHNAMVIPPVHIGHGVQIINSIVGPNVTIDNGAHIHNSIIQDSILGQHCTVEASSLKQSIIGNYANVQGGYTSLNVGDNSSIVLDSTNGDTH